MKKSVLVLGVLVTSQFAFGFQGLLQKQVEKQQQGVKQSRMAKSSNSCTNFAGKWKGTCDNEESILKIEQSDCATIQITSQTTSDPSPVSEVYDLTGMGLKSQTAGGLLSSSGFLSSASWSGDKQTLQFEARALVVSPFLGSPMTPSISVRVTLDGPDLVAFSKIEGTSEDKESECRYQKMP